MSLKTLLRNFVRDKATEEAILGNEELLTYFTKALTHPSYNKYDNFETFEHLGDGIVNICITCLVFNKYKLFNSELNELYNSLNSYLYSKTFLSKLGMDIDLISYIKKSPNEPVTKKLYTDVMESLTYALFLTYSIINPSSDNRSAYYMMYKFVAKHVENYLDNEIKIEDVLDYKSILIKISDVTSTRSKEIKDELTIRYKDHILDRRLAKIKEDSEAYRAAYFAIKKYITIPIANIWYILVNAYNPVEGVDIEPFPVYDIEQRNMCYNWIDNYFPHFDEFLLSLLKDDIYSNKSLIMASITHEDYNESFNYTFFQSFRGSVTKILIHSYIQIKHPTIFLKNVTVPDHLTNIIKYVQNSALPRFAIESGIKNIIIVPKENWKNTKDAAGLMAYNALMCAIMFVINKHCPGYGIWFTNKLLLNEIKRYNHIIITFNRIIEYNKYIDKYDKFYVARREKSAKTGDEYVAKVKIRSTNAVIGIGSSTQKQEAKNIAVFDALKFAYENDLINFHEFKYMDFTLLDI